MSRFIFPKWSNSVRQILGVSLVAVPLYAVVFVWFGFSPKTTNAGYMPKQPVPFSHRLHAGELGMDCRYCHTTVEDAAHAAIPQTQVCMGCHGMIKTESELLQPIFESYETGMPVEWVRVHDLPDYVYFNHSAHVLRGVGCQECHGRIDKMDVVYQEMPLSMGWCLDCHRDPEPNLRPKELVTEMGWEPEDGDRVSLGQKIRNEYNLNPSTDCSTCHR